MKMPRLRGDCGTVEETLSDCSYIEREVSPGGTSWAPVCTVALSGFTYVPFLNLSLLNSDLYSGA